MFNILVIRAYIALKRLWCRASALLREKRGEIELPDHVISTLAHGLLQDIIAFFQTEDNKNAYKRWKCEREHLTAKKTENMVNDTS